MKKDLLLVTMLLISIFSMLFAKIKASEASVQKSISDEHAQMIDILKAEAEEMRNAAEEAAAEARAQLQRAEQAIADCKGS